MIWRLLISFSQIEKRFLPLKNRTQRKDCLVRPCFRSVQQWGPGIHGQELIFLHKPNHHETHFHFTSEDMEIHKRCYLTFPRQNSVNYCSWIKRRALYACHWSHGLLTVSFHCCRQKGRGEWRSQGAKEGRHEVQHQSRLWSSTQVL